MIDTVQSPRIEPEMCLNWPVRFSRDIRYDTCTSRPVDIAPNRIRYDVVLIERETKEAGGTYNRPEGPCYLP